MSGYDYPTFVEAVAVLLNYDQTIVNPASAAPSSNAAFNVALPRAIEYSEHRIYRELDLVSTSETDTGAFVPNNRKLTLPTSKGVFVVVEQIAVLLSGVRQPPLLPASREFVEATWPAEAAVSASSQPLYWTLLDNTTALVGPSPGTAFGAEVAGTMRPAPLSATNTTTPLTTLLPDLFLAGSLVWLTAYQRDWGAQSEDPKMAQSWSNTYDILSRSAGLEESRKQFQSQGWSARAPMPLATPPQT